MAMLAPTPSIGSPTGRSPSPHRASAVRMPRGTDVSGGNPFGLPCVTEATRRRVVPGGVARMAVLEETERMIVDTVHEFVDRDVRPVVQQIEHANEYPEKMIEQMKELGIFGLAIPEELGGTKVSM